MQLYNANFSPNALRVRAVIYELGIDVETIEVDVRTGGNQTPEFLKLNPAYSGRPVGLAQPAVASRNDWLGAHPSCQPSITTKHGADPALLAMWAVSQVVMVIQQPSQPAGSDPAKTSDTTGPQAQLSPTSPVVQPGTGTAPTPKPLFGK